MSNKILRCPFCCQDPVVSPLNAELDGDDWGRVACMNPDCGLVSVQAYGGPKPVEKAVKKWNRAIKNAYRRAMDFAINQTEADAWIAPPKRMSKNEIFAKFLEGDKT